MLEVAKVPQVVRESFIEGCSRPDRAGTYLSVSEVYSRVRALYPNETIGWLAEDLWQDREIRDDVYKRRRLHASEFWLKCFPLEEVVVHLRALLEAKSEMVRLRTVELVLKLTQMHAGASDQIVVVQENKVNLIIDRP